MKPHLTDAQLEQVCDLWLDNLDTYDIAQRLGVPEAAVWNDFFFPDARPAAERDNVVQLRRMAS